MPNHVANINPLKKVRLKMEAGRSPDRMDLTARPLEKEFIFGIGPEGFSAFEYELVHRGLDDRFTLAVERAHLPSFMGHLLALLPIFPGDFDTVYLKIRIEEAIPADQREVIRAMADLAACEHHCCGHEPHL